VAKTPSFAISRYTAQALLHSAASRMSRQIQEGKVPTVTHRDGWVTFNSHGDCKQPYVQLFHHWGDKYRPGTPSLKIGVGGNAWAKGKLPVEASQGVHFKMLARCRKCDNCIQWRSRVWMARAMVEVADPDVLSYFGTLTFSPTWAVAKGCSHAFDTEDAVDIASKELTLALKRHRKENRFRYFAVLERGELRGRLHWHVLLHRPASSPYPSLATPVGLRYVFKGWHAGFTDIQLVDVSEGWKAAAYVSKYITKCSGARVRASQGYGKEPEGLTAQNNRLNVGQSILDHWNEIDD